MVSINRCKSLMKHECQVSYVDDRLTILVLAKLSISKLISEINQLQLFTSRMLKLIVDVIIHFCISLDCHFSEKTRQAFLYYLFNKSSAPVIIDISSYLASQLFVLEMYSCHFGGKK